MLSLRCHHLCLSDKANKLVMLQARVQILLAKDSHTNGCETTVVSGTDDVRPTSVVTLNFITKLSIQINLQGHSRTQILDKIFQRHNRANI